MESKEAEQSPAAGNHSKQIEKEKKSLFTDDSVNMSLKRKNTPEKDLSHPKKPEPPFSSYCTERMAEVKAKHPEMSVADTNDTLLAEWNDLSADRKQVAYPLPPPQIISLRFL